MTEPTPPPEQAPITLDAAASHLRRRAMFVEDEALMLSTTVRDLAIENSVLQGRIADLADLERDALAAEIRGLRRAQEIVLGSSDTGTAFEQIGGLIEKLEESDG